MFLLSLSCVLNYQGQISYSMHMIQCRIQILDETHLTWTKRHLDDPDDSDDLTGDGIANY